MWSHRDEVDGGRQSEEVARRREASCVTGCNSACNSFPLSLCFVFLLPYCCCSATALQLLGGRHAVKSYLASLQAAASPSSSEVISSPAVALSTPASAASHPVASTSSGGGLSAIRSVSDTTDATTCSSSYSSSATTPLLPVAAGQPHTTTSGAAATAAKAAAVSSSSAAAGVSAASASPAAPAPSQSSFLLPSAAAAATEEKLFLRLSVADPVYFKYVASTPTPAAGLLLRVRVRRRSGSSIEILGRVVKHHSFEGLADFYYTPPRRARAALDFRSLLREEVEHGGEEEERKPLPARHPVAAPEEPGYFSARRPAAGIVEGADSTSFAATAVDTLSPASSFLRSSSSHIRHQILPFIPPPVFCRFTQPAKHNLFDVLFADEPSAAISAPATRGETPGSAAKETGSHTAVVGVRAASGAAAAVHTRLPKDPSRSLPFAGCRAGEVSATAPPVVVALDPAAPLPFAPAAVAATSTSVAAVDNSTAFASQCLHRQQQRPKQPRTTGEGEEAIKSDYSLSEITVGVDSSTAALPSSVPTLSRLVPSHSVDDTTILAAASATSAADAGNARAAVAVPGAFRSKAATAAMPYSPADASPAAAAVDWGSAAAVAATVRVPSVLQLPQPHQRTDEQQRQKRMLQQQQHVDAGVWQSGADEEGREKAVTFPATASPSATTRETEAAGQQQQQEEGGKDEEGGEEETAAAAEAEVLGLSSRKAGEEFNAVCRYGDPSVPVLPPPAAARAAADEGLLLLLQQMLQQQPIWLRSSLDALLPAAFSAWRRKPAYARTCFFFADGPWRGCLCRLGYDPRKTPASRFYQTIDMRDPFFRATNWRRLKEKENVSPLAAASLPAAAAKATFLPPPALVKQQQQQQQQEQQQGEGREGEEEVSASAALPLAGDSSSLLQLQQTSSSSAALLLEQRFLRPPSRPSVLYQLKEIQDDVVQKLLQEAPVLPVPCKETGWFPASTMKSLRELLVIKSERMRSAKSK